MLASWNVSCIRDLTEAAPCPHIHPTLATSHPHPSHSHFPPLQYASSASRTDPATYDAFFASADAFVAETTKVIAVRDALAPGVKLDVNECGVILPNDNDANAPQFPLMCVRAVVSAPVMVA